MILVTSRDHLAAAMSRVGGIINKSQTIPILANVLLTTQSGFLTIRSSNADMEAVESIPAEIGVEGETTVSAERLAEISRLLPTGAQIGMKLDGEKLTVTCGKSRFSLATLPAPQFPQLWLEDWDTTLALRSDELAAIISHVDFAQHPPSGTDFHFQGIRLECKNGRLRAVATNRAVIAICDGPAVADFAPIVLPSKFVTEALRMLALDGDAMLGFSEGKATLRIGNIAFTSKLIDRHLTWPDYEKVIPAETARSARIPAEQAIAGIRRAMIAGQNLGAKGMTVRVILGEGRVAFTARNSEADAFDEIAADVEGDDVSLPLNPPYLIDALGKLGTEFIDAGFGDKKSATIWRPVDGADALVVIMPQAV